MKSSVPASKEPATEVAVWVVVSMTVLAQFLFAGNIFGFASLQVLLEADDVFRDFCDEDEPVCSARTSQFVLLYSMCAVCVCSMCFPVGFITDTLGPAWGNLLGGACEAGGLWLLGISGREDVLMFGVALVLCSLGSSFILFAGVPLAFIVPSQWVPMVVSMSSNAFDASAVLFMILYQVHVGYGFSRSEIFMAYSIFCVVMTVSLAAAWFTGPLAKLRARQRAEISQPTAEPATGTVDSQEDADDRRVLSSTPPLHGKSFCAQVRTREFVFTVAFFSINVFLSNSYLGLNKSVLESLGDAASGYFYTSLFMGFMPASCLGAPVVGYVLRKFGFAGAYGLIAVLSLVWMGVVMVPVLPVQPVAFLSYSCYRSVFYSAHFTFLGRTFGSRTSSSVGGLISLIGSVGQIGIYFFTDIINTHGAGQLVLYYFLPCLVASVPGNLLLVCYLRGYLRRVPAGDCREAKMTTEAEPEHPPACEAEQIDPMVITI